MSESPAMLTVVNYHYVHDLERPDFPNLRGLDVRRFAGQVEYLSRHHEFVGCDEIRAYLNDGEPLPESACLLTFDDGLRDHRDHVVPVLERFGIRGLFYVPAKALEQQTVLSVHKLHLLLGSMGATPLAAALARYVDAEHPGELEKARASFVNRSRFDDEATAFVKWILTSVLPAPSADAFLDEHFSACFGDEAAAARRLYLDAAALREMLERGMHVGGHGEWHHRLDELSAAGTQREIDASLEMIETFCGPNAVRSFAYPYGVFTPEAVAHLAAREFHFAWATNKGRALGEPNARLCLRRDDTNGFPQPVANA